MRRAGWHTIAQDQASSVVYGMPKAAARLDAAAEILPLDEIAGGRRPRAGPRSAGCPGEALLTDHAASTAATPPAAASGLSRARAARRRPGDHRRGGAPDAGLRERRGLPALRRSDEGDGGGRGVQADRHPAGPGDAGDRRAHHAPVLPRQSRHARHSDHRPLDEGGAEGEGRRLPARRERLPGEAAGPDRARRPHPPPLARLHRARRAQRGVRGAQAKRGAAGRRAFAGGAVRHLAAAGASDRRDHDRLAFHSVGGARGRRLRLLLARCRTTS